MKRTRAVPFLTFGVTMVRIIFTNPIVMDTIQLRNIKGFRMTSITIGLLVSMLNIVTPKIRTARNTRTARCFYSINIHTLVIVRFST